MLYKEWIGPWICIHVRDVHTSGTLSFRAWKSVSKKLLTAFQTPPQCKYTQDHELWSEKEEEDGAGGWFDFYSEPTIMIDHGEAAGTCYIERERK